MVEGQTEKEKEYFKYIRLKNHMRTRLPRTYQKSEMIYDDVDLKPSNQVAENVKL